MLKKIFQKIRFTQSHSKENSFDNLMYWANDIGKNDAAGLKDLIKIILRPIQAEHIRTAYLKKPHEGLSALSCTDLGITGLIPTFNKTFIDLLFSDTCRVSNKDLFPKLNLASDVTLPTAWHPTSLVNTLGMIGKKKLCGPFKQSTNHMIIFTYPLSIGWVVNGNHSIIQAILRGEGEIMPTEVYDISSIVESVCFDGTYFKCISTGTILGNPRYEEFGWVWEIGRLIMNLENNPFKHKST